MDNNPYAKIDPDGREPAECSESCTRMRATSDARALGASIPGAAGEGNTGRPLTGPGHHQIPNQTVKALGITSPPALKVFDSPEARIPVENHNGARPSPATVTHDEYNRLATKEAREYMQSNKIDPTKMTESQAKDMLRHFKRDADPRIRQFNQVQFSKALQQAMRRAWYRAPIKTEE